MPLKMLDDKVAIAPLPDPDETSGGIIIPEIAKQRIDQGIVIYKGPKVRDLKIGQHVFFSGYAGSKISIENEGVFFIMREQAVGAVLDESAPERGWAFTSADLEHELKNTFEVLTSSNQDDTIIQLIADTLDTLQTRLRDRFFSEGLMF